MTKSSVIELEVVEVVEEVVVTRTEINPKASPPQNPYLEASPLELFEFKVWVKNEGAEVANPTIYLTRDGLEIGYSETIELLSGVETAIEFVNVQAPVVEDEYFMRAGVS